MARRVRRHRGSGGSRVRFDESEHPRDGGGRFRDKPGAGDDAPKRSDLKSSDVGGEDRIVSLKGNEDIDGKTVKDFISQHPEGKAAALHELAAGKKEAVIGFTEGARNVIDDAGRAALLDYTGAGYRQINAQLRGIQPMTEQVQAKVVALDKVLKDARLEAPLVVHRGVGSLAVQAFEAQGLRKGSIITDAGFLSTSKQVNVAREFAQQSRNNIRLEIRAKAGAKALDVSAYSDSPGDQEVLFARNSRMKVLYLNKKDRTLVVEVQDDD